MNTRILFIDDSPERVQLLRDGEEIFYVRSSDEAAAWLQINGTPEIISFDHDLSLLHYGDGGGYGNPLREPNGHECAKWCVSKGYIPKLVVVHSWNPDGAKRIARCFEGKQCQVVVRMFNPKLLLPRVR